MYSTEGSAALPWRSVDNEWTKTETETKVKVGEEEDEGLPAVRLRLGTGENAPPKRLKEERNGKLVFTAAQLNELHLQVIIYRHIEDGLPVPLRLLYFASLNLPTFLSRDSNMSMLDPEPGRCRRTDGKKWRCRRNVVPHEKYCERHIHRGSQRSRKHVELSETTLSNPTPVTAAGTYSDDPKPSEGFPNLRHVGSTSGFIMTNHKSASSNIAAGDKDSASTLAPGIATHVTNTWSIVRNYMSTAPNVEACNRNPISTATSACTNTSSSTGIFAPNRNFPHAMKDDYLFVKRDEESPTWNINKNLLHENKGGSLVLRTDEGNPFRNIIDRSIRNETKRDEESSSLIIMGRSINYENTVIDIGMSPEVGVSLNSVLQGSSSACMKRNENELEPGRCRRTGGKRWRCKRDVVTGQKYCSQHMHRGSDAKKHARSPLHPDLSRTSIVCKGRASELNTRKSADRSNLGKNLSIAVPSPELDNEDERSRSSCSSDATISDTIFTD